MDKSLDMLGDYIRNLEEELYIAERTIALKQQKIDKANYILEQILVISDKDYEGQYRPVKNTSRRDVYKAIVMLNEILETPRRANYEILGDKENE